MAAGNLFSLENEVFRMYLTYGTLVVFKMLSVAALTAVRRMRYMSFVNEEDFKSVMGSSYSEEKSKEKMAKGDPVVDRYLRIHRNDLENIPAFLLIGLMFVGINPAVSTAMWHFRIFCIARYCHYVAYAIPLPQPSRGLSYGVGMVVTLSMGVQVLRAAFNL